MLALLGIFLTGSIFLLKRNNQKWHDKNRRTYTLIFPADLELAQVTTFMHAISGTLKRSPFALDGTPTIAFELWASDKGIQHRIKVPWQHADYVIGQLLSLVPGLRYEPDDSPPEHDWTRAVELGETKPRRKLRVLSPEALSASLLASVQTLGVGEAVLIQTVATPAVPERLPSKEQRSQTDSWSLNVLLGIGEASSDEITERRAKLSEPNMLAVLRVAAKADSEVRADHLMYRVQAALAATRSADNRWNRRTVRKSTLLARLRGADGSLLFPAQLSVSELTSLIAWPLGNPQVAGLPRGRTRYLPPTEGIAREGRVIGISNTPGQERPLAISAEDACKHVYVLGPSGTGKTALLSNMAAQDMAAGYGVVVMESKGDLFNAVLQSVPRERVDDVIVIDLTDSAYPPGFNIFEQGDPRQVVDDLTELLANESQGVYLPEMVYHGGHTLLTKPGLTFIDLVPLLQPQNPEEAAWRDQLINDLPRGELRDFWKRYDGLKPNERAQMARPVMERMWRLSTRSDIRNVIGQSTSSFKMTDVLRDNRILLINLSASLGRETVGLVGSLIVQSLWNATRAVQKQRPTFLYIDEFQNFTTITKNFEEMAAQARSFGLGMVVAHQHLGQLDRRTRDEALNNLRSKVVFQSSAQDASVLQANFGQMVSTNDFVNLGKYEAIARLAGGDGISSPVTLQTKEPPKATGAEKAARMESRRKYGRPAHQVDIEIRARRSAPEKPVKSRPRIGFEDPD